MNIETLTNTPEDVYPLVRPDYRHQLLLERDYVYNSKPVRTRLARL